MFFKFVACVYKLHLSTLFEIPLHVHIRLLFQSTNLTNACNIEFTMTLSYIYVRASYCNCGLFVKKFCAN